MDANEAAGGDASAPSPMEMVLHGAAGCMAIDIGVILRHHMGKVTKLEIEADGERAETEPKYYKHITMNIIIDGDITANRPASSRLSKDKYCSAVIHSLQMST
ncbi:OsmC family protein [Jeotgalicoccus sp. WY2]|uniref:OsmC family protein n=1 Tax=Jeotgalicoccus sp. WY2 TaxID=2708346 RepID=UPI001BD3E724|nr:OsmC family protein [Jeotgalicoccus sp. WY2]